jgi:hypothetical protein
MADMERLNRYDKYDEMDNDRAISWTLDRLAESYLPAYTALASQYYDPAIPFADSRVFDHVRNILKYGDWFLYCGDKESTNIAMHPDCIREAANGSWAVEGFNFSDEPPKRMILKDTLVHFALKDGQIVRMDLSSPGGSFGTSILESEQFLNPEPVES